MALLEVQVRLRAIDLKAFSFFGERHLVLRLTSEADVSLGKFLWSETNIFSRSRSSSTTIKMCLAGKPGLTYRKSRTVP